MVHKLGLICTYSGFVQIQTHNNVSDALKKIFRQNLAKESKIALLRGQLIDILYDYYWQQELKALSAYQPYDWMFGKSDRITYYLGLKKGLFISR